MNSNATRADRDSPRSHPRREAILNAAVRAFSTKGYPQVTLQEIADSLGITKAAIYYYFRQKQQILGEALERAGKRLVASVEEVAAQEIPPAAKVRGIISTHIQNLLAHRALYSVYFTDVSQVETWRHELILKEERAYAQTLTSVIERGIAEGQFRHVHPRSTTLALLGMCNSTLRWFHPTHGLSAAQLSEELAETAVRGLLAELPCSARSG